MLTLDHITLVAPSLDEGVAHVRTCLDVDLPFGRQHPYMGTHNRILRLSDRIYLEVIAVDPSSPPPATSRWFGLDEAATVRTRWDNGQRLSAWVARTSDIAPVVAAAPMFYPVVHRFAAVGGVFSFAPACFTDLYGCAAPSLIQRSIASHMPDTSDRGCSLSHLYLDHPEPEAIHALYARLGLDGAPAVRLGRTIGLTAEIRTPYGTRFIT